METIYFGVNPNPTHLLWGNLVQFWFLTVIGAVVGIVFYFGLTSPKFRRLEDMPLLTSCPKRVGAAIGIGVACLIIGMAYAYNWTRFYQVDIEQPHVTFHYFFPRRTIVEDLGAIRTIDAAVGGRGNLVAVVRMKSGRIHRSADTWPWVFEKAFTHLKELTGVSAHS